MRDPGGYRIAGAGAEAAERTGVEPVAGPGRLDEPAGERHEVAAVADDHGVVVECSAQLAVDARGVDRVVVAREQLRVRRFGRARDVTQRRQPLVVTFAAV